MKFSTNEDLCAVIKHMYILCGYFGKKMKGVIKSNGRSYKFDIHEDCSICELLKELGFESCKYIKGTNWKNISVDIKEKKKGYELITSWNKKNHIVSDLQSNIVLEALPRNFDFLFKESEIICCDRLIKESCHIKQFVKKEILKASYGRCKEINSKTIDLFDNTANKYSEKVAIVGKKKISYGKLQNWSKEIAFLLIKRGVVPGDRVILNIRRSEIAIACLFAIWRCGATYVPISQKEPMARWEKFVIEIKPKVIICDKTVESIRHEEKIWFKQILLKEEIEKVLKNDNLEKHNLIEKKQGKLAYILYTSGSTGEPKGVEVSHLAMMNHIYSKINLFELNKNSIVAQSAEYNFAISIWQSLAALLVGGQVVIIQEEVINDMELYIDTIQENRINVVEFVPSYLNVFLKNMDKIKIEKLKRLRKVEVTGEKLTPNLVENWFEKFPNISIINGYGQTETTDDVTYFTIKNLEKKYDMIPIGFPTYNSQILILDEENEIVPFGISGEIYVGGLSVGEGYYNDKERTKEKFVKNIKYTLFNCMFKTGDIGVQTYGGGYICLGRRDDIVKVKGIKIDLNEVRNSLLKIPGIEDAIVIQSKYRSEDIVAYVTGSSGLDEKKIRNDLKLLLPHFMIPNYIEILEEMPILESGKIDRIRLIERPLLSKPKNKSLAKKQDILQLLVSNVLKMEYVDMEESLENLGMDSLKIIELANLLRKNGYNINVCEIHLEYSLKKLANYIKKLEDDFNTSPFLFENFMESNKIDEQKLLSEIRKDIQD